MVISEAYQKINRDLHAFDPMFGRSALKWTEVIRQFEGKTILDYGCGKGTLKRDLGFDIAEYDPGIPGKDSAPEPADVVVCIDVLEHIEPECLDDVLAHMHSLMGQFGMFVISTREARKLLPDGRNAHLIVQEWEWWKDRLEPYFKVMRADKNPTQESEVCVWVKPK
jgi:2-polyprenyl-3-methyl-5-hydroxy-6-metoxy-1,4-benzoquinol methylase